MEFHVHFTEHAELRCAQRNVSKGDALYVMEHSRPQYSAGSKLYFLRRRDVSAEDLRDPRIQRLIGVCVLTKQVKPNTIVVLTLYHNEKSGLKDHRRKDKTYRRKPPAAKWLPDPSRSLL